MSYVRWGDEGSHVYVVGTDSNSAWCVGCEMVPRGQATTTLRAMVDHLKEHVENGDVVPLYVFDRLEADIRELDVAAEIRPPTEEPR